MSLARQFGFEVQPKVPTKADGTPFTSLAVCLKSRAQAQALSSRANLTVVPDMDSELSQAPDGSLQFILYVDTTTAMGACKEALASKGFHFAKLSENKLLVVLHHLDVNDQVGFELSVASPEGSACTSVIKFSLPPTYGASRANDAIVWSSRVKELHYAIVFPFC